MASEKQNIEFFMTDKMVPVQSVENIQPYLKIDCPLTMTIRQDKSGGLSVHTVIDTSLDATEIQKFLDESQIIWKQALIGLSQYVKRKGGKLDRYPSST